MSISDIRKKHQVPAKRGQRVRFTDAEGTQQEGRITSSKDGKLRVPVVDKSGPWIEKRFIVEPDQMEYLES